MENPLENINNIINSYNKTIKTYEENLLIIKKAEDETQDLLHEIELSKSKDLYNGYLIYKYLKECREKRRQAKEENELLEEFYQFSKTQTDTTNKLQKIRGHIQTIRTAQQNRVYRPKERTDLKIGIKNDNKKPFEVILKDYKNQQNGKRQNKYA